MDASLSYSLYLYLVSVKDGERMARRQLAEAEVSHRSCDADIGKLFSEEQLI